MPRHPKGTAARLLLTSVFGPYCRDDEFGSRSINPMELYHNQVTRAQGEFSLRMFHRSWGLMMLQHNVSAPSTLLDFPSRKRFARELTRRHYDVVGISAIVTNVGKVREMCRMVRELSPGSVIVVGGHVTAIPDIDSMVDADHFVRGEGIAWLRHYLGEDEDTPIRHPAIVSGFGLRIMGMSVREQRGRTAATVVASVGCPMGCNFCTTSAFFGGKGKSIVFYQTGDALFDLMCELESSLGVHSFFIMDENFLLQRPRALRLLERMKAANKSWALYVFSSPHAIARYTIRELVELGISWIWLGLESPQSNYAKLAGVDVRQLLHDLRQNGIRLLASTIVGLEHHTPENMAGEIADAVSHGTDFHQFMLYTPVPGTPLYQEMQHAGRLLADVDLADIHGQDKFNFQHAAISRDESKKFLDWAFLHDFRCNGPSLYRICQTLLAGWKRYKNDPDPRVRKRFQAETQNLKGAYNAALWAMEHRLRHSHREVSERVHQLRGEVEAEFGWTAKLTRAVLGPIMLWSSWRESRRLARGFTLEPPTIVEQRNWAA